MLINSHGTAKPMKTYRIFGEVKLNPAFYFQDLKTLEYGDRSIVGEKGYSLSGGQKARINLAR